METGTPIKYHTLESKGKGKKRKKIREGKFVCFNESIPDYLIIKRPDGMLVDVNRIRIVEAG